MKVTNVSELNKSLDIINSLFDGKVPSGSSVSFESSTVYNSEEKQNLIEAQKSMNMMERLQAMKELQERQRKMSPKKKCEKIVSEWGKFQKHANQVDIASDEYDCSMLDFRMNVFDFAQYGITKEDEILDDFFNYVPFMVEPISAYRIVIYFQNCNRKSPDFGKKISIEADQQTGPEKGTLQSVE